ncbi:PAS domain S-box protein [Gilvimarinus polysaccharolyticus]|uniref:PAS domain S-box protein n=1 Tax=Gilvimarinus polysaccharolyticus TaxID=863921 RepID=UPI0006733DEC|nr:PAS domain S-box protein [Gilvimarinus polysaccharolyticus]
MASSALTKHGSVLKSVVTIGFLCFISGSAWAQEGAVVTVRTLLLLLAALLVFTLVLLALYLKCRNRKYATYQSSSQALGRRLQLALENSQSGYWDWDVLHDRVEFSDDWKRMFGLSEDAVTQDGASEWMARVHPDDRDECLAGIKAHITGQTERFEHEHRLRDERGRYLWFLTRGRVIERDGNGRALQMIGVYTDVNARKRVDELVIHQQKALEKLNEIASLPSSDAKDLLRQALGLGADYLGLPFGIISQVNGENYRIYVQVSPPGALEDNQTFHLSNCFCVETLNGRDVMAVHHTADSSLAHHPCYISTQLESYIGAPVWVNGEVYGTLNYSSPEARATEFSDYERNFVRVLARWVGSTLERSLQERENRKLSETFARLSDSMPGCLVQFQKHLDGSSCFPYASRGIVDIYGVTPDEVRHSAAKVFEHIHPDDLARVASGIAESARTMNRWNTQYRVVHPTRGLLWVRGRTSPERQSDDSIIWHGSLWDVTEEVMAEQKLSRTNRWRDAIFDVASLSFIITDVKGVVQSLNVGANRILGYAEEELLNRCNLVDLYFTTMSDDLPAALTCSSDKNLVEFEVIARPASQGQVKSAERTYRCKDGRPVRVMETIIAVRDDEGVIEGYLSVARDITLERSQAEKLRASAERTQAILDNVADGIVLISEDGAIVSLNLAAERIFDLPAVQAEGLGVERLLSDNDESFDSLHRRGKESGGVEVKGLRMGGDEFPLELSFSEIFAEGERLYVALMRDITDRKRVERMKNEFIATVSHELRTPLTAISGSLRLLESNALGEVPDTIKKMISVANNNSDRLLNLVNDLLDIEKLVAGKVLLKLEHLVMANLLRQIIEDNAAYAAQFDVTLRLDYSGLSLPAERYLVHADSQRVTQILVNLISNAVKFSYAGGEVVLQLHEDQNDLVVSVVDNGVGISDEFRDRIFEKFSQADSSTTKDKGGTGLGLAICKEIVEQHKGSIGFESSKGHGSRFYFALPCTAIQGATPCRADLRVLQVEDDDDILQLTELLVGRAVHLTQVSSIKAARQALGQAQYDIILLDILLPDGSGLDLLSAIAASSSVAAEVVALTHVELNIADTQKFDGVIAKNSALAATLNRYWSERMRSAVH